jgi:hypothetical protein
VTISAMAGRLLTVYRRTASLLDATTATASMSVDRQPPSDSVTQVAVTVDGGTGTVTVSGTVDGAPDSEVLTFTGAGTERTIKLFSALDAPALAVSAGLVGVTISARAEDQGGALNHVSYVVVTGVRAHLNRSAARWPNTIAGTAEVERTWFGIDWTTAWAPRDGDVFVDQTSLEEWLVVGHPDHQGGLRPHHWEVRVVRREGSVGT